MQKDMTLKRLIQHLENIYTEYGNIPVEGNIICGERGALSSLCVINGDSYEDSEKILLIEVLSESMGCNKLFSAYEYPSMKTIELVKKEG